MDLVRIHSIEFSGSVAVISFDTGEVFSIDFAERVKNRPKLRPLLAELDQGKIVDDGIAVEWPCGIDIDAQSLHRIAKAMGLRIWRANHGMTQATAGEALGISGRSIRLYENGTQPIPKTVTLATRGYDAVAAE
jgi:DNA-binding XRE family transcriptional regulator